MKRTTIVRIAEWTGWCGPCAAERPLVLTRTGRHSLRSWIVGSDGSERPLTLTCRLCGVGVAVPPEADDPEVVVFDEAVGAAPQPTVAASGPETAPAVAPLLPAVPEVVADAAPLPGQPSLVVAAEPVPTSVPAPVHDGASSDRAEVSPALLPVAPADLQAARQEVATMLSELLHRREAAAHTAAILPQQRSGEGPVDGLQALQLLAEGLDLLSTSR